MTIQGFIKNEKLLQEDHRVIDQINTAGAIEALSKKLESINQSGLLGFIGKFGIGKSTLLHNVRLKRENENEKWIEFDAWKFPDRKNLWEGFVLELTRQIDEKTFEDALKKIDGKENDDKKTLVQTLSDIPVPGFKSIRNLNHFFRTSPARRVFEIQQILIDILNKKLNADQLCIVIEDIDRSSDAGIFFLETLKQFIKESKLDKKVLVIVPIGEDNFRNSYNSYLKCLDYFEWMQIQQPNLEYFVNSIINETAYKNDNQKKQFISFLSAILNEMDNANIRLLKLILRKANMNYKNQTKDRFDPDFRLSTMFETAKYFHVNLKNENSTTYFKSWRLGTNLQKSTSIFSAMMDCLLNEAQHHGQTHLDSIYNEGGNLRTTHLIGKFISSFKTFPPHAKIWTQNSDGFMNEGPMILIPDFYLSY